MNSVAAHRSKRNVIESAGEGVAQLKTIQTAVRWIERQSAVLLPLALLPLFLAAGWVYADGSGLTRAVTILAPVLFYAGYAVATVKRIERNLTRSQARFQAEMIRRADEFSPDEARISRQYFESRLAQEIKRGRRHEIPLCVVTFTTPAERENAVHTWQLVDLTTRVLRAEDVAGRLGRHAYALCLPHTTPAGAEVVIDRLRTALGPARPRFGVAYLEPGRLADAKSLLQAALAVQPQAEAPSGAPALRVLDAA